MPTAVYPPPVLRPPAPRYFPAAVECTDEELLELAALGGSDLAPSYVTALCGLVERQDLALATLRRQLEIARGVGATSWTQLQDERDAHHATQLELGTVRGLLAQRDTEAADAARLSLRFQTVTLRITGRTYDDLQVQWAAEDLAESAALELATAERRSARRAEFDVSDTAVIVGVR